MSLLLPPSNSPIRKLFDMAHLAEICSPENRKYIPTLEGSREYANKSLDVEPIAASINLFVMSDRDLLLVEYSRTKERIIWDFGPL